MEDADDKFISRVASIFIVGVIKMQALENGQSRLAAPLEQDTEDKELLLSLLANAPEKTKTTICNLSEEDAANLLKKLYDSIVARSSDERKQIISLAKIGAQFRGICFEKEFLRGLAKDEKICRTIFSENAVKFFHSKKCDDEALKEKYREAKQFVQADQYQNPIRQCACCGMSKPSKHLKQCVACMSIGYCNRDCQVKHWKSHKKVCKSLEKDRIEVSQPDVTEEHRNVNIPNIGLAVHPSLTGFEKEVLLLLPMWDLQDGKQCLYVQKMKNCDGVVRNLKSFFKLELLGGETPLETVGNMCTDALILYWLGYKDINGNGIRNVSSKEAMDSKRFSMTYTTYTKVPKGWRIPAEDRPFIPPHVIVELEKGIEWVRKNFGEREAL